MCDDDDLLTCQHLWLDDILEVGDDPGNGILQAFQKNFGAQLR